MYCSVRSTLSGTVSEPVVLVRDPFTYTLPVDALVPPSSIVIITCTQVSQSRTAVLIDSSPPAVPLREWKRFSELIDCILNSTRSLPDRSKRDTLLRHSSAFTHMAMECAPPKIHDPRSRYCPLVSALVLDEIVSKDNARPIFPLTRFAEVIFLRDPFRPCFEKSTAVEPSVSSNGYHNNKSS